MDIRRLFSDFMDMFWRLINYIIITIVVMDKISNFEHNLPRRERYQDLRSKPCTTKCVFMSKFSMTMHLVLG